MNAYLNIRNLRYRFGERSVLNGVSIDVPQGTLFCLVGPNGSGKTTLFRLLASLLRLQEGSIDINGKRLSEELTQVRREMGVVFQLPALDKKLTVEEHLWFRGKLYSIKGTRLKERTLALMEEFQLTDRRHDLIETLSGGMRRRVELAASLIHAPKILLADEPTVGLDPRSRQEYWALIRKAQTNNHLTVLFTTHLMEEAEQSDRIAILDAGKVVALGRPDELRNTLADETISIASPQPKALAEKLESNESLEIVHQGDTLKLRSKNGTDWLDTFLKEHRNEIDSITVGKSTLEDFFLEKTGRAYQAGELSQ